MIKKEKKRTTPRVPKVPVPVPGKLKRDLSLPIIKILFSVLFFVFKKVTVCEDEIRA
jgi:hypothetical protein